MPDSGPSSSSNELRAAAKMIPDRSAQEIYAPEPYDFSRSPNRWPPQTPPVSLRDIDLTRYTQEDLMDLQDRLNLLILGPKPPTFTSTAEADAWMDKYAWTGADHGR